MNESFEVTLLLEHPVDSGEQHTLRLVSSSFVLYESRRRHLVNRKKQQTFFPLLSKVDRFCGVGDECVVACGPDLLHYCDSGGRVLGQHHMPIQWLQSCGRHVLFGAEDMSCLIDLDDEENGRFLHHNPGSEPCLVSPHAVVIRNPIGDILVVQFHKQCDAFTGWRFGTRTMREQYLYFHDGLRSIRPPQQLPHKTLLLASSDDWSQCEIGEEHHKLHWTIRGVRTDSPCRGIFWTDDCRVVSLGDKNTLWFLRVIIIFF